MATEYVPYGETPLAGSRLDRLRALAAHARGAAVQGPDPRRVVRRRFLPGRQSPTRGSPSADVDLPASKCDLVGNPFDDSLSPAQRQSVDFANFAAMLRQRTGGAIQRRSRQRRQRTQPVAYPEQDEKTTAGAWNIVAAQNNRVEFHVIPEA